MLYESVRAFCGAKVELNIYKLNYNPQYKNELGENLANYIL